ncbi:S1 family peptidase [Micromonospora olivasterospora]|nr:S1 family peptidase [Micromonospora olivasterospora]
MAALVVVPGLLAGPMAASAAPTSPSASSEDPQSTDNLDPALLAEMRWQNALQPAVTAIWDVQVQTPDSGFAGLAYEDGGLTLYWKGALTPDMSAALDAGRAFGLVRVKAATNSEAELHAAGRKIHAAIDLHGGSDIQSISYAPDGSGLQITRGPEVTHGEPAALIQSESSEASVEQILAEAQVDVPVQVTDAVEPLSLLASRLNDTSPWNGGGRWESWRGLDHRMSCTTGFGVHAGGRSYVLSAGHCATPPDDAYQGTYGGTFKEMGPVYDDDWRSDLLLINAPGWYLIFDGSATTSTTKAVRSWGYWAANELVCQSGMKSGTVCGIKQQSSTDLRVSCNAPDSDGDCDYTIYGLIKSTQVNGSTPAQGGDSGGPVFTLDGTGVRAKGIVSGGGGTTMYFQDWADVIRVYGAYPNTNSSTS